MKKKWIDWMDELIDPRSIDQTSNQSISLTLSYKGKVDNLYRGSIIDPIATKPLLQYPLFIGFMPLAATYRRVDMKALARYQIILLGEQRHIGVNNLPKVVARQCSGRELNPRPPDHESNTLATTPPSHIRFLLREGQNEDASNFSD